MCRLNFLVRMIRSWTDEDVPEGSILGMGWVCSKSWQSGHHVSPYKIEIPVRLQPASSAEVFSRLPGLALRACTQSGQSKCPGCACAACYIHIVGRKGKMLWVRPDFHDLLICYNGGCHSGCVQAGLKEGAPKQGRADPESVIEYLAFKE